MGSRRFTGIACVLVLASTTPGCITALAAAAGADARTISQALEADTALANALVGGSPQPDPVLAYEDETTPPERYGEADEWRCLLADGEEQRVSAYSLEGARAACLLANDADLVGDGCICIPAR